MELGPEVGDRRLPRRRSLCARLRFRPPALPAQFRRMHATTQHAHSRTQHARTRARILRCCRAQVLTTAEKMRLKGEVRFDATPPHAVSAAVMRRVRYIHIYIPANGTASRLCTRTPTRPGACATTAAVPTAAPLCTTSSARKAA